MSTSDPSKFAENTFLSATDRRYPLVSEILADTLPRAIRVTAGNTDFLSVIADLTAAAGAWNLGSAAILNAEAALPAATYAFTDKMASLTRKPDADSNSPIEIWDNTIRGEVAYQGPTYMLLLPQGRETLTRGTREEQLEATQQLGARLAGQITKPELIALGLIVTTFADAGRALRTAQTDAKADLDAARVAQETNRVEAARCLYALIGQGMVTWSGNPALVDTLFDINILRNPPVAVPAPPADTTWAPASRTLATTALPESATRLEAWRLGPGGTPELLATGTRDETALVIPAAITFHPGSLYQLWLVALNGKGKSAPGPVQNWTAV